VCTEWNTNSRSIAGAAVEAAYAADGGADRGSFGDPVFIIGEGCILHIRALFEARRFACCSF